MNTSQSLPTGTRSLAGRARLVSLVKRVEEVLLSSMLANYSDRINAAKENLAMLSRNEVTEFFLEVLSGNLGIPPSDINLDHYLQSDLGIEEDDFEDVAANLSQILERPVLTSELFDDDITLEQAVSQFVS
jgi:hypothetical protein